MELRTGSRGQKTNALLIIVIFMIGFMLIIFASGCSDGSTMGTSQETGNNPYHLSAEPQGEHFVAFNIIETKYQIFIPNDFKTDYENGHLYEEGVDAWIEGKYQKAEKDLRAVLEEIKAKGTVHPDDQAFVEEALGCLYIDWARYAEAYDLLMDSLVTLKKVYGEDVYYPNTVSLDLCQYYFAMGDYDRCLQELQRLRDNFATENHYTDANSDLKYFIIVAINDLEADIDVERGQFKDAYSLYLENLESSKKFMEEADEDSLSTALLIHTFVSIGDCSCFWVGQDKYYELAESSYDNALKYCEYYADNDSRKLFESEILLKKGYLYSLTGEQDDLAETCITQALETQESIYLSDGGHPKLVETYRAYAEFLGFIVKDDKGADEYYQKSLELGKKVFGSNHPEIAKTYESMGRYYGNKRRDDEKAIDCFDKGIEIYKNLLVDNNPLVADMYLQKAGCYKLMGDTDSSDKYLEKAYEIYHALGIKILQTDGTYK